MPRENRSVYLNIRLTPSEREAVERAADKQNKNASEWLRNIIKQLLKAENNMQPIKTLEQRVAKLENEIESLKYSAMTREKRLDE